MKITGYFNERQTLIVAGPVVVGVVVVFLVCFLGSDAPDPTPVMINGETFLVELADTDEKRRRGLMYRRDLPDRHGMLFVFERPEVQTFWMKNTYVALDIIFMDADRRIINIATLPALSDRRCRSERAAMYVLELSAGSARRYGIEAGMIAEFEVPFRRSRVPHPSRS